MWRPRRGIPTSRFKLYLSPRPERVRDAFTALVVALAEEEPVEFAAGIGPRREVGSDDEVRRLPQRVAFGKGFRIGDIESGAEQLAGAQGIRDALDILIEQGRLPATDDLQVVVLTGDGSAYGMGMSATSGAMDRGLDFIYLCYDNEGYGNTGQQFSGATPHAARTVLSPSTAVSVRSFFQANIRPPYVYSRYS